MSDRLKPRKYAVVDLEATNPGRNASIIQVGIVIIEGGRITRVYETDVNPYEPLDSHIKHLTGLTDERLSKAPDFAQVAREIFELIEDAVFVAHNVRFDANLLAEHLFFEGYDLHTPRVDTVELAQIFFPTLEKYNLPTLSKVLGLQLEEAHTAISDAYATAQLFLKLQEKIATLPRQLLEKILVFADSLLFETRLVIEEVLDKAPVILETTVLEADGIVVKGEKPLLKERAFADDFGVNLALLELEQRPKQMRFADLLVQAFEQDTVSFLQAQTGIGKTYAYLLTLLAKTRHQKVIVSVPTIALQNQLMAQEISAIQEVFHVNALSVKSPRHYISLEKFADSLSRLDKNRLVNRYKMQLLVWLFETETGDLDEIRQKHRYEAFFESICHDGEVPETSRSAEMDFVKRRMEQEKSSRLIVTNHAYLLTRVADDKAFLDNHLLVIDEAQSFFLALEQLSRRRVDMLEQLQILSDLQTKTSSVLQKRLLESLQFKCQQLVDEASELGVSMISLAHIESLRQDLSEYSFSELIALEESLSSRFREFWLERRYTEGKRQTYLNAAQFDLVDVSSILPDSTKVFYISATLSISPELSLADLLGYEEASHYSLAEDKVTNQAIWIDTTMPMVSEVSEATYLTEVAHRLIAVSALEKPTVVLFTSRQAMLSLSDKLDESGIRHLCQDKHGQASHLKNRFDKGDSYLLLGTGTFWEGVDFAKQEQLLEVIVRLPFDNPEDRFTQKINERIRRDGKHPFYDYSLPLVALRLKQAIGRTNRSQSQKSAVLILDSRLLYKSYGTGICTALSYQYELRKQPFEQAVIAIDTYLDE